jgi:hypothetical protein
MKFTPLIFGLLLVASMPPVPAAPSKDVNLTAPPPKDSPALADKKRGSAPDGPIVDSARRGGLEDMVEIIGVAEDKPDADGRRKVTVRVRYALVHYAKGVLSLGFNLKSATHFVRVTDKPVEAGADEIELSAVVVPVVWPKEQPFKLSVGLSAEVRPQQWSLLAAVARVLKAAAAPASARPGETK